jgi:hypothetical protein
MADGKVVPLSEMRLAKAFANRPVRRLSEGITGGFSSIGYRAKVLTLRHRGESYKFTREDDGTPSAFIDMIILDFNPAVSKAYYGDWDEDNASGPICFSIKGEQVGPDASSPEPQAKSCLDCVHNQWPGGGRGKACKDHKRLAVMLMPKVTSRMLGAALMEPVFFKVPPGSLTALRNYDDQLQHMGFPCESLITRVSFSQDKLFQFEFSVRQMLSDKEAKWISELVDKDPQVKRIIGVVPDMKVISGGRAIDKKDDADEDEGPMETGLLEAAGLADEPDEEEKPKATAAKRGRPPGKKPSPPVEDEGYDEDQFAVVPQPAAKATTKPAAQAAADDGAEDDIEVDEELGGVKKLGKKVDEQLSTKLNKRISEMLPKS